MRKSRFTETQIIGILKAVEAGRLVKDVCREHSISDATYYQWKSKYGGMEAADIKRLKDLEDENRKLKMMVADLSLENHAFKEVIGLKRRPRTRNAISSNNYKRLGLASVTLKHELSAEADTGR